MDVYPVTDLVAYLAGSWSLERGICELDGTPIGSFTGTATFTPEGSELVYTEHGTLRLGNYQGPAHRGLRYRITGPGQATVHFDYGDVFHELDLRQGQCAANHPCRDDLYEGRFLVEGHDRWLQEWTVSGPTKNHTLTTRFGRDGGANGT